MTTNELLACITPGANEYIQKTIRTKNVADYQKLKKLFDEHQFEAKSFEDSHMELLTFDWQNLERDRNWWWQLQALPFLNWYASSFSLQSEEEHSRYLSLCIEAIDNWINQAKLNKASPLVWHDHAAAFRVRNLTNWLVFCHTMDLALGEVPGAEHLGSLIIEHLDWLQEDNHYTKHTNHGFDQAMIALTIASMFVSDNFEAYRHRNRVRLKDEVTFAFTDEGVHKENSPGYQKMMLGRLKQLRTLAQLGDLDVSLMGERYIEKAEAFLRAVTLPNGELPLIGDTQAGIIGIHDENRSASLKIYDYSDSGYVVLKGFTKSNKAYYFLLKNSHLSNYHRHDDDLMLYLWFDGEVILGDGGLYSHNEKCELRKFFRSHYAHNLPFIHEKVIRDRTKLSNSPELFVDIANNLIKATSYMFGVKITREVDYSNIKNGALKVIDNAEHINLSTNHFIGTDFKLLQLETNKLKFVSGKSYCSIAYEKTIGLQVVNGAYHKSEGMSIYSNLYNEKVRTFRVMFSHECSANAVIDFGTLGSLDE